MEKIGGFDPSYASSSLAGSTKENICAHGVIG